MFGGELKENFYLKSGKLVNEIGGVSDVSVGRIERNGRQNDSKNKGQVIIWEYRTIFLSRCAMYHFPPVKSST